ncbi:uncharacterized protein Pyn_12803 [Prunus yedoensis var. nudiflora]|uniref:Uncharacterized protein n=1 Tax=Prunus yedoensis var. nudiflora TaxID=2094558 RepID=A0A314XMG7_PRUYE|nr:uncharacterized protein Pyn_12803 [Prunus yedoensis var. nudiflora]
MEVERSLSPMWVRVFEEMTVIVVDVAWLNSRAEQSRAAGRGQTMKLFDAHCHLQDPRIFDKAPQLIAAAVDSGVVRFAVNGVSEKDWHLVKQISESYPCVIPCFGLHPWYVAERTPNWLNTLKQFFEATPSAAVGEIGLDKGSQGKKVDFTDQVNVFRQQLELAKELKRPASIHCVRAFGSAEMVPEFANLGAYFSFSGFLMSMKVHKAKRMLKMVPSERILLETDAPDALPKSELDSAHLVEGASLPEELQSIEISSAPFAGARDVLTFPKEALNHPQNIHKFLRPLFKP